MAAPTGAYVFRDASLKIGATDFANNFSKARLVPDTPIQTLRTLVPDGIVQDTDSTVWTLEVTGIQDWTPTTGLAAVLYAAALAGTTLTVIFVPKTGSGNPEATVTIKPLPVDFGGDQGSFNTFDATFPVIGAPTFDVVSA